MMSVPDSSSLPIPTFHDTDGTSPKNLLAFLQKFIQRMQNDNSKDFLHGERTRMINLFESLHKEFLPPLPLPEEYPWDSMHERSTVSEVTFDMMYRLARRCREAFSYQEDLSKSIFVKLLDFSVSADVWIDVPNISVKDGFPSPDALRLGCVHATIGVLHAYADCVNVGHAGKAGWQIFRDVAEGCISACLGEEVSTCRASVTLSIICRASEGTAYRPLSHPFVRYTRDPPWPTAETSKACK